jgi:hypothetical protein
VLDIFSVVVVEVEVAQVVHHSAGLPAVAVLEVEIMDL